VVKVKRGHSFPDGKKKNRKTKGGNGSQSAILEEVKGKGRGRYMERHFNSNWVVLVQFDL
jgi:hypothetical protein